MIRALWKLRTYFIMGVVCVLFLWTTWLSFSSIVQLQGNARVINYAGIVRGATQRLIKQELHGQANDALIARLDGIVDELLHGDGAGKNRLIALPDPAFQSNMAKILEQWAGLKREIAGHRADPSHTGLYPASESYFDLVDETVSLAEMPTESQVLSFKRRLGVSAGVFAVLFLSGIAVALRTVALRRRADMLGAIAFVDPLTGMPNRAACHREIASYSQPGAAGELAVFVFDMNNLKRANDVLGHNEGDKIIAAFGGLLHQTFDGIGFAGRYGGDEFIAFLRRNAADAERLMAALRQRVDAYNQTIPEEIRHVQYAGGFAVGDVRSTAVDELIKDADREMYNEKRNSRESMMATIMDQVADASRLLVQIAGRVDASSQELVRSAESEKSLFADLSAVTETLQSHAVDYTNLAVESSSIIVEIRDSADSGEEDVRLLTARMEEIAANAREIHGVLKAIANIAFQTRILSLNAAVEAARAGRYGRGFSVVADEVRGLAIRSEESVGTTDTVLSRSDELVGAGVTRSHSTSDHLVKIAEASHRADELMAKVSARAQEQRVFLEDVVTKLSGIVRIAGKNSEAAVGNAKTARSLLELAHRMRKMLNYGRETDKDERAAVLSDRRVG